MLLNNRSDRRRNRTRSHLSLEMLEGRQLMTLGAQFPTPINTTHIGGAEGAANASSANGSSVVVWTDTVTPTNHDIYAQRLNSAGLKIGPEIIVSNSPDDEGSPSVAIDNQGDFVVAWTQTQPNGNTNILAQKFNPSGNAVGGIVPVAVGTFAQTDPHVAMDAAGDFVVAYTRNTNNNNPDIFAKLYNVNEQLVSVVSVATTSSAETNSSVAMTPDGRFDVAYQIALPGNNETILNAYSAQGALLEARTIAFDATNPSVSVDNAGNAVVAWQQYSSSSSDVLARRVSSSGVLGPVLNIATPSYPNVYYENPSVALTRDGSGAFVVAYDVDAPILLIRSANQPSANQPVGDSVQVAEVTPSNTVTTLSAGPDLGPAAVSINNSGQYLVTYTTVGSSTSATGENINGRLGQLVPSSIAPPPGPTM